MKAAELFDVRGLVTIVTGAASGIGLAYAEVMADNGARETLMDRDASSLEAAVRRLAERGGDVRGQTLDVTDRPGLRAGIDAVAAHYGRLDVVFANVGIDSPPGFLSMHGERNSNGAFENVSDERWDLVMETNLTSMFGTIKAAVPHMKKNAKGGRIIVTTSVAAIRGEAIVGMPYMPAKAGRRPYGAAGRARAGQIQYSRQRHRAGAIRDQYRRRPYARPGNCGRLCAILTAAPARIHR
jgi:NAD(P)-dependent dehydrogenase (short-subunit alcohol dehydrogenase family)